MRVDPGGSGGPPFPTPVQFDTAAAEAVLTSLKSAIANLRTRTASDQRNAATAEDGWKGMWADQFATEELPWMEREAGRVLAGMLALQSQISNAIDAAHKLQAQQNSANQRWAEAQRHGPV